MKILLVEDEEMLRELYIAQIKRKGSLKSFEVVCADSVKQAEAILESDNSILIIVMDGDLKAGGGIEETSELVKKIKERFSDEKILVANSSNPDNQSELINAGCQFQVPDKDKLVQILEMIASL